jgi:tetratricopeptide (TPR) repeat protein
MSKVSLEAIAQYEKLLEKDPASRVFAALADAYRDIGRLSEAEKLASIGIKRHPDYVGGYLALSRIFLSTKRASAAEDLLKQAVQLSPENLLAYQLLGQAYLELKRPMEALKAHKMVLFLNPLSEKSREAVARLEALTATEYDDDLFEMAPLKPSIPTPPPKKGMAPTSPLEKQESQPAKGTGEVALDRELSLIDALIVRNDIGQARTQLLALSQKYPDHPLVHRRWSYFEDEIPINEIEEPIRPLMGREKMIWDKKRALLEGILHRIDQHRLR